MCYQLPRSFIAIDANEKVRNSLRPIQNRLEETGADLKLVSQENIHMTLKFLGDVFESRIDLINDAINEAISLDSFEINIEGLGVFPKPSYIRVIWAGVSKGSEKLGKIRQKLDSKLAELDFSPEDEDFTPHFTIARVKSGKAKDKLNSIINEKSEETWGTIEVDKIELKKSELTSEGPIYTTIGETGLD